MELTKIPLNSPEQALADLIVLSRPYTGFFDCDHYPACFEKFEKAALPILTDTPADPGVLPGLPLRKSRKR